MRALRFLLRKEFLQITRDHVIMRMILIMPLVQLLVLANAVTFEVRSAQLYLLDQDHSEASRGVVERLVASGRFELAGIALSRHAADEAMLRRDADVILVIPEGFEEELVRERAAPVQLILNAEDGGAAAVIRSYAGRILESYSAELGQEMIPSLAYAAARDDPPPVPGAARIDLRRRGWYNAEMDYRAYMVPGILVVLVTMIGTLLTAMNIVREKESGTLDQLNVTPISRAVFIAAKLIPLWTFAMVDLALGIGLWISTVVETQQQAMFLTFALLMVYLLMSGLFTPVNAMPEWAQWLAELNPVAHFVHLMRAVLLKGAGIADVARQLVILAAGGAVVLTLAVRQYRKRSA